SRRCIACEKPGPGRAFSLPRGYAGRPPGTTATSVAMRLWIVLYAIGAAQAGMLATALWRRPANAPANRVLSAWLAIVAVDLAVKALHMASPDAGLAPAFRIARLLPFAYA